MKALAHKLLKAAQLLLVAGLKGEDEALKALLDYMFESNLTWKQGLVNLTKVADDVKAHGFDWVPEGKDWKLKKHDPNAPTQPQVQQGLWRVKDTNFYHWIRKQWGREDDPSGRWVKHYTWMGRPSDIVRDEAVSAIEYAFRRNNKPLAVGDEITEAEVFHTLKSPAVKQNLLQQVPVKAVINAAKDVFKHSGSFEQVKSASVKLAATAEDAIKALLTYMHENNLSWKQGLVNLTKIADDVKAQGYVWVAEGKDWKLKKHDPKAPAEEEKPADPNAHEYVVIVAAVFRGKSYGPKGYTRYKPFKYTNSANAHGIVYAKHIQGTEDEAKKEAENAMSEMRAGMRRTQEKRDRDGYMPDGYCKSFGVVLHDVTEDKAIKFDDDELHSSGYLYDGVNSSNEILKKWKIL